MISVFRTLLVDLFLRWNRKKLFYFAQRSMHLNIFFFCHPIQQRWAVSQYQTQYSVVGWAWNMEEWRRDSSDGKEARRIYSAPPWKKLWETVRGETLQLSTDGLMSIEYWDCYWENGRSCWLMYRQGWWPDATGYFLNQHQAKEKGVSWLNKSIQINIKDFFVQNDVPSNTLKFKC